MLGVRRLLRRAVRSYRWRICHRWRIRRRRKIKLFGIGRNKTGTTSLATAMHDLGYICAPQRPFELLFDDWVDRRFDRILKLCRNYEAFQDTPFSLPYTYQALDRAFPGSKFVLTVRDSAEAWYRSVTRFHSRLFGGGEIPTSRMLREAAYCYPGWMLKVVQGVYHTDPENLYDRDALMRTYERHNESVVDYFVNRPDDLLVLNVASSGAYAMLCEFLGQPCTTQDFPWKNQTDHIAVRAVSTAAPKSASTP
ncbi:MAG: hypothetical protein HQ567_34175 [Candidatus Nealsonbacteria bacterium]|nr:hypothetical protein [Candidatus Nealsonbacteria bacterium]